jgi:hypothetical protein
MAAAPIPATLPALVLMFVGQRFIIEGFDAGLGRVSSSLCSTR